MTLTWESLDAGTWKPVTVSWDERNPRWPGEHQARLNQHARLSAWASTGERVRNVVMT